MSDLRSLSALSHNGPVCGSRMGPQAGEPVGAAACGARGAAGRAAPAPKVPAANAGAPLSPVITTGWTPWVSWEGGLMPGEPGGVWPWADLKLCAGEKRGQKEG